MGTYSDKKLGQIRDKKTENTKEYLMAVLMAGQ
jgi:hypothetical protein